MSDADWGDLVDTSTLRPVWNGQLTVSTSPQVTLWWKAWQSLAGGMDVLHVGVTGSAATGLEPGEEVVEEIENSTHDLLGGVVDMVWRSVGRSLKFEVVPVHQMKLNNRESWIGRVIVKAYSGTDFDPLMVAIQKTKDSVET